jgi:hypothetical protein
MQRHRLVTFAALALAACLVLSLGLAASRAGDGGCCHSHGCTHAGGCRACVPACSATWDEVKTKKPTYTMTCEYACARGRDSWHVPPPECRCCPPCGNIYVKKRFYKADGEEKVERIPTYEVQMVPAEPCDSAACRRGCRVCWWNPFSLVSAIWDR